MGIAAHTLAFESLDFIRSNAAIFRKYFFLPTFIFLCASLLDQIPFAGLALSTVTEAIALSLVGVSATRFYLFKDADVVAEGANIPFARFFFLTFMISCFAYVAQGIIETLPALALAWMWITIWVDLKLCLAFPALAADRQGSVLDIVKGSLEWTRGNLIKLIMMLIICFSPVLFFLLLTMGVKFEENPLVLEIMQHAFMSILMVFCHLWSSVALAKFYQAIVSTR